MFFLIPIALAEPSTSGECEPEVETSVKLSGKELYNTNCAGCHKADGTGERYFFPPLVGTPWIENPAAMTEVLFRGVSGTIYVRGDRYASYMSPYGLNLTDAEIIQLISYVRTELNSYAPVETWTEQKVSTLRSDLKEAQAIRGQKGLEAVLSTPQSAPK